MADDLTTAFRFAMREVAQRRRDLEQQARDAQAAAEERHKAAQQAGADYLADLFADLDEQHETSTTRPAAADRFTTDELVRLMKENQQ